MYIGQETNDWEGDFPKDIDHILATYADFYLSGACFRRHQLSIRTYHPNYLWRNGFYAYIDDIVGALGVAAKS
jgi:hypothetical protein